MVRAVESSPRPQTKMVRVTGVEALEREEPPAVWTAAEAEVGEERRRARRRRTTCSGRGEAAGLPPF